MLGVLYIQFMLLLATFAFFPAILIHERNLRNSPISYSNLSMDERWSRTKKELDKLSDNLNKAKSAVEQKNLQRQKISLENELRQIEWKVKESDLNQMYNASKGNLRELPYQTEGQDQTDVRIKNYNTTLSRLLKEIRKTVEEEPQESRRESLILIANSLRAHYNAVRNESQIDTLKSIRSDYFASWMVLASFIGGYYLDPALAKYTSRKFRKRFLALVKTLELAEEGPIGPTHCQRSSMFEETPDSTDSLREHDEMKR